MRLIGTIGTLLLQLALFAGAALAQDVRYNFASGAGFDKYKTYKWVQVKGTDQVNQLADEQIRGAFDAELAKKGLTKVDKEPADLYIAYQVALGHEKQITMYDTGWGYGPGWGHGWYGGGGGVTTGQTSTITVGQLDIDMYDSQGKSLVWRATATKTLDMNGKPEKRQKNLTKAVAKILKNYPPNKPKG